MQAAERRDRKALPEKENKLFRQIIKLYEDKKHKKALKNADAILKKFPDHGETLAMKGLIYNCQDKKREAYDLVKRGLKCDPRSHVSWHVYGLLYRSDRDYKTAIKCYINALKFDPNHLMILRDLSLLQIHMRYLKGFVATRSKLININEKSTKNRGNWIALAVGHHLLGNCKDAIKMIEIALSVDNKDPLVQSELLMYKAQLLEEDAQYMKGLLFLKENESLIRDKLAVEEQRGRLYRKLNISKDAERVYLELIKRNPEENTYITNYLEVKGFLPADTKEKQESLNEAFEQLLSQNKSTVIQKLQLQHLPDGELFEKKLSQYLKNGLRKGVPSLFVSLKPLYTDLSKVERIEKLVNSFLSGLEANGTFPDESEKETPLSELWTLYFLGQHYDKRGQSQLGLSYLDRAIDHTPTAVEVYKRKGTALKHLDQLSEAADVVDKARQLDLADRYLNTKATLFFLRADRVDEAERTIALFSREGDLSSQHNLYDMQCMWWELECGESYLRQKLFGKALKKFVAVKKHFDDIYEDQLDFHAYCWKKGTLRSYVALLRMENTIYSHKNFSRALTGIVNCYLNLNEKKHDGAAQKSTNETKKTASIQKKPKAGAKKEPKGFISEDPDGEELANVPFPLKKAAAFARELEKNCPSFKSHLLAAEVFFLDKKYLQSLRSLLKANKLDQNDPQQLVLTTKLFTQADSEELNPTVRAILDEHKTQLCPDLEKHINDFKGRNASSVPHRYAAAEALMAIGKSAQEVLPLFTDLSGVGLSLKLAQGALQKLQNSATSEDVEAYKEKCRQLFPTSDVFA